MEKLTKDFFGGEVLVCGCGKADNAYYKRLHKHFTANGVKVLAMPTNPESELGFETYPDYDALPNTPQSAYVLSAKADTPAILAELDRLGVKRVLFYGKVSADDEILADCAQRGMEVRMGCPLMLYAPGPCWLHAAAGGVLSERRK